MILSIRPQPRPSLLSVAHTGLVEISVPPLSSSLFVISVFSRGNPPFAGGKVSGSAQFGFSVLGVFRGFQVGLSWSSFLSFASVQIPSVFFRIPWFKIRFFPPRHSLKNNLNYFWGRTVFVPLSVPDSTCPATDLGQRSRNQSSKTIFGKPGQSLDCTSCPIGLKKDISPFKPHTQHSSAPCSK